jgi:hypothetical protein
MRFRIHTLAAIAAVPALSACGAAAASMPHATTVASPHVSHGRTVSPKGAPYRYTVPAGFTVASTEIEPTGATPYRYLSMVEIGRRDLISVKVEQSMGSETPADEASTLMGEAAQLRSDFAQDGAHITSLERVTVAAHPAVRMVITGLRSLSREAHRSSAVRTLIFTDAYNVLLSCQWAGAGTRAAVAAGCASVERSLVLRDR